ncbi:MAG: hypothetical protein M3Y86_09610 [Verrucomicrobiota bacterium]|nr:hypothetical protein [Verrucomicrobiota bacterium]
MKMPLAGPKKRSANRRVPRRLVLGGLLLFIGATICISAQAAPPPSFAIYLIDEGGRTAANAREVRLGRLVLSDRDLIGYVWRTHSMMVKPMAWKRLPRQDEVGVRGLPFAVVADGAVRYRGAFWTSLSSVATEQPVIDVLAMTRGRIQIQRGYPSGGYHPGPDPRNDARVRAVLRSLGKLR